MLTCTFENGDKANHKSLRHAVVDVLVLKDNKILLVKRIKRLLEGGKWGVIGGFTEPDETLVETCRREVYEETGYRIKGITLLTIRDNPDRPNEDRQNISFVFFCSALEKEGVPDKESDEQRWFSLTNLPSAQETAFDHALNIALYQRYQKEKFTLPILPSFT